MCYRIVLLLFSVFLFQACSKDAGSADFINDISPIFELAITQTLSDEGGMAALTITTVEDIDCLNSELDYSVNLINNTYKLYINGPSIEDDCLSGNGPISALVNFDNVLKTLSNLHKSLYGHTTCLLYNSIFVQVSIIMLYSNMFKIIMLYFFMLEIIMLYFYMLEIIMLIFFHI